MISLPQHRRANIWLAEPLPAQLSATSTVTRRLKPHVATVACRRFAAVELSLPRAASSYALLGAELVPTHVDDFEIVVLISESGAPFQSSLPLASGQIRVGGLQEYATAVIVGVEKVVEAQGAPTMASLQFGWAAHGVVGSSPAVFARAAAIVMRLLTLPTAATDDAVRELIEETLLMPMLVNASAE